MSNAPASLTHALHVLASNGELPAFETGDTVTVWPREDRASGMIRDTEPGLQPWPATFLGYATDGKALIAEAKGKYNTHDKVRSIDASLLRESHGS